VRPTTARFPRIEFRVVGCNLGDPAGSYYNEIVKATSDIDVQVVFSNAGYLIMRSFYKTALDKAMINFHCNIVSHVKLAHYFFGKMATAKMRGCIVFTSSLVSYFPAPANALYATTKAALSQLGACLGMEGAEYGIDVMAINAGPMHTRFTEGNSYDILLNICIFQPISRINFVP